MRLCRSSPIIYSIRWMIIILLLVTGCGSHASTPRASITPAQPTDSSKSQSADSTATLSSLEMVDDYPLYVMQYSGGYEYPQMTSISFGMPGIGCSLFASMNAQGDNLYGRNFDWDYSPALILFTDPPDGYASASMVDLTFLGISSADAMRLSEVPMQDRKALLSAPALPFDGMNEYGLTIGMAAIPDEYADDVSYDPARPMIGSIGIMRQILDHARSVDEALEIFGQYNVQFGGGPPIHYLLADRSGKAVLVEFYRGELIQLPNEQPWHLATNHLRCIADGDGGCWRYRTLSERLATSNGLLDGQAAMQLLSQVKQDSTQWSAVYNMTSGDIQVVIGRSYDHEYKFHLDIVQP